MPKPDNKTFNSRNVAHISQSVCDTVKAHLWEIALISLQLVGDCSD